MPPSLLEQPDLLSAKQHAQMERDLELLLPEGPLTETAAPLAHPQARRLAPEIPLLAPRVVDLSARRGVTVTKHRHWRKFPVGGWAYWETPTRMQRRDQGQDFEVKFGRHVIAPGWGKCVHHLADGAFPNGFGTPYAVVYIGSGRFGGRLWYIGHVNSEVIPVNWTFHTGKILGRPDHSLSTGWGWVELGHAPNGYPGSFAEGQRWAPLFQPVWRWSDT